MKDKIILKAADLFLNLGFKSVTMDDIAQEMGISKKTIYAHFKNKTELVREVTFSLFEMISAGIEDIITMEMDPIEELYEMMHALLSNEDAFKPQYDCPAINLIQEMAPLKESFNKELMKLMKQWKKAIEENVQRAISTGQIASDTKAEEVSTFMLSGYGGVRNLGKLLGKSCYQPYLNGLKSYLQQL